jgi:hypothetical protein
LPVRIRAGIDARRDAMVHSEKLFYQIIFLTANAGASLRI